MDSQILFSGIVMDVEDNSLLNRVRVHGNQEDIDSLLEKFKVTIKEKYPNIKDEEIFYINKDGVKDIGRKFKFSKEDPFIYRPLLPFHLKFVPKKNELVLLMYWNKDENNGRINQFYIPGLLKSPMNVTYENAKQSAGVLSQGILLKPSKILKNFLGNYIKESTSTIWAKPEDNAIYGRGSSDLILKEEEVLLRAGKASNMQSQEFPKPNKNLGFFQITYLPNERVKENPIVYNTKEVEDKPLVRILEYDITNGLDGISGLFTGSVKLFNLPSLKSLSQKVFSYSTELPPSVKEPTLQYNFDSIPLSGVTSIINKITKGMINGESVDFGEDSPPWSPEGIAFPFFFRPSKNLRDILNATPNSQTNPLAFQQWSNLTKIFQDIKPIESMKGSGYGLIPEKGKIGELFKTVKKYASSSTINNESTSYSILGSDRIYLISYNDKNRLKNENTYGLDSEKISDLRPNTESMVRGDSLYEFLRLMYQFLKTHVHAVPEEPPIVTPGLKKELQDAYSTFPTKVLNQDIRIS